MNFLGLLSRDFVEKDDLLLFDHTAGVDKDRVDKLIAARLGARKSKNFKEADRIRDELAAMGVALMDSKDPKTGEIVTTWEVRASGTTEVAR